MFIEFRFNRIAEVPVYLSIRSQDKHGDQTTLRINLQLIQESMAEACLIKARRSRYSYGTACAVPIQATRVEALS
jgi:hypothetical protein